MIDLYLKGISEKYPSELLDGRVTIEGNVCGCIIKDILLLDDSSLTKDSFITKDGRFIFSLLQALRNKGINYVDEVSILSSFGDEIINKFNSMGGYETLSNIASVISLNNWESYITSLHRENTILKLYDDGFNLLKPITVGDKDLVQPLKLFKKMTSDEITEFYESRMASYQNGYSSKILEEEEIDFDDEYLESCADGEENGVSFGSGGKDINGDEISCLPYLSNHIMGFSYGTFSIIGGYSSTGKSTLFISVLMGLLEDENNKILIISNEQKIKDFKKNFIVWILFKRFKYYNLTKKKLIMGIINEKDQEMLKKAQSYWREKYKGRVKMISIPNADTSLVKREIRKNVLRFGYNVCLYDTMKLDFSSTDKKEYLSLIKDSRDFDEIAKKYNIIMLASLQLAINTLGTLFLNSSVLSMSKQIKESLENLILMRTVYGEELDPKSKYYFKPYRLVKDGDIWVQEECELDPNGVYRAIFIDKCRSSSNSSDTGKALCYKYLGEFAVFKETCWIAPKHGVIQ